MSYYDRDYELDRRKAESDYMLRSMGFVRDEYGHYEDPNNVTRTGAWIDPRTGDIHRDM